MKKLISLLSLIFIAIICLKAQDKVVELKDFKVSKKFHTKVSEKLAVNA